MKKKVTKNADGSINVPAGTTGKQLETGERRDVAAEVRAANEAKKKEKEAAKAKVKEEKEAAKAKVKEEKEAAKKEMDEAKGIAAEAKAKLKAEKEEAKKVTGEAKDKVKAEKAEALEAKKKEREAAKQAKAEAKANKQPTGADLIRKDYLEFQPSTGEGENGAFTEEQTAKGLEAEYTMGGAAKRLGIDYGRVYGCITKYKEGVLLQETIERLRKEKAAQA